MKWPRLRTVLFWPLWKPTREGAHPERRRDYEKRALVELERQLDARIQSIVQAREVRQRNG